MSGHGQQIWVTLSPSLSEGGGREAFRAHAETLAVEPEPGLGEDGDRLDELIQETMAPHNASEHATALRAALYVLTDLARQRWLIRLNEAGEVQVRRPDEAQLDPGLEKARIRAQELVKRDEQLRHPAARKFVKEMERRSLFGTRFVSIYSLIRDGRELAAALREARSLEGQARVDALREAISPYLQFVDDVTRCEHTNLRLQDIWRYFRHTWTNQYTSTPGRSMAFIVRDRACPNHPVIGIGALGSSIVQMRERDSWIGWHPDTFLEFVSEAPSAELGRWLQKTADTAISELYHDDLIEEEVITAAELRAPTSDTLKRLTAHGEHQRELHRRLTRARDLKKSARPDAGGNTEAHWIERARTHLYRSKRALTLAEMLRARMTLQRHLSSSPSADEVSGLLGASEGRRVIKRILRKAKADRVGVAMADITVCGAVAPYGPILGGKLVSMLAASPQVVAEYGKKYSAQESEIASSMAGRPIVRPSALVFLGTTSLYGVGSSQYNRLRMPAERLGGAAGERLAFLELGKSQAYGTSHFSSNTVDALVSLVHQSSNGQRVNSIFGEGVSPKLRKIRGGLDVLNLPADALLQHGRHRIIYGVPVVRNLREFLLGLDDEPDYIFNMTEPTEGAEEIGRWWAERWLYRRVESDDVISRVEGHTLVQPICHGARVTLPRVDDPQGSLFDDIYY